MRDVEIVINEKIQLPEELKLLANVFGYKVVSQADQPDYFIFDANGLSFSTENARRSKEKPVFFDLEKELASHRLGHGIKRGPFAQALKLPQKIKPLVWDLTCGTGKDSMLIMSFGFEVIGFERDPIIGTLLRDAQRRLSVPFQLRICDPLDNPQDCNADILYFDPMFGSEANAKSLPRKELRIFRELELSQDSPERIFDFFSKTFAKKLIIKRPLKSANYNQKPPHHSQKGKSVRYDVYMQ